MTITPANAALTVYQNATFSQLMLITNADGTLVDFTGNELHMQARTSYFSTAPFIDISTLNGGILILLMPAGNWNAATNSPTLADGSGQNGQIYNVTAAGTQNLGSGAQTFAVGDYVQYNGSIWQKIAAGTQLFNVELLLTAAQTAALIPQEGVYDLVTINTLLTPNVENRILQGSICISAGVTQ